MNKDMGRNKSNNAFHSIDTVFVLILFAVFVIMALFISASGALAYKNSALQMEERFDRQTCISYITAKIRSNNENEKISVVDFNGSKALCITDRYEQAVYKTYIYQYEGMIRELFFNPEAVPNPNIGSPLTKASGIDFLKESDNLYKISLTDANSKTTDFYVNTL